MIAASLVATILAKGGRIIASADSGPTTPTAASGMLSMSSSVQWDGERDEHLFAEGEYKAILQLVGVLQVRASGTSVARCIDSAA